MNDMKFNRVLWFTHEKCEGEHYLIGNPHTFPGRMLAWCPCKERFFYVSKSEIIDLSDEAKYWIEGFLHGNEPEPPTNGEGEGDSDVYREWLDECSRFQQLGHWQHPEKRG